ncbi:MAG: ATP-binding cassette domain-containing protein, partial [Bacteroidales bacterium]|nr:ATP-binding cassette domain-containing protein [Bacteroidales bacterium]
KSYFTHDTEIRALNNISLEIHEHDFAIIFGSSGSGKSSLLSVIGMLEKFDKGNYFIGDHNTYGIDNSAHSRLRLETFGYIFQNFNLIGNLTVFENIELPLKFKNIAKVKRHCTVNNILNKLGLLSRKDHYPRQLSGGQQQRIAVGRALVTKPKIIIADEPTGNLDSLNGNKILELLVALNKNDGTTIIMVTHNKSYSKHANKLYQMKDGHLSTITGVK